MTPPSRPSGLPPDAAWNARDREWELGEKKDQKNVGVWTWWRGDGKIVCRSTFGVPGKLDGPFQRFHPNGEVCLEGRYELGKPVGLHAWQFCAGKTDQPFFFTNILSVGPKVKKVVVDYQDGRGAFAQLADTARFFDAKGVETDRKGVPLADQPVRVDIPAVPGRDLPRMIARLFGKKAPAKVGKTWVERELFLKAMKGVDASQVRFFGAPADEHGTWLLNGQDRWDTMSYEDWIGCLEKALDPSQDFDGADGILVGCAGFTWLPLCGLVGVAYQLNEGGVDAYMVSGLAAEKTANVYSWLTTHTSGSPYDLRFNGPSISHLLFELTDRERNDPDAEDERLPSAHFVAAEASDVDPVKRFEGRLEREGCDPSTDPSLLYWRAEWIVVCLVGLKPELLRRVLDNSKKIGTWEAWRVHPAPRPTSILYWLLHQYIYGNSAELAEVVKKARRVKGFRLIADLVKLLSKKNPVLPGYPLEQARLALRAAGETVGGPKEVEPEFGKDPKAREALALLNAFERSPNAFAGPNPWYRDQGSEDVRRFAALVDDRFRDLVRGKLVKALKVGENKPGATRGLLLAWGKLARDYAEFKKAVGAKKLGDQRQYELGAAYARFLDDPGARKECLKLAAAWIRDPWKNSSEAVWTLLERDTPETRAAVAKLLETAAFDGPTWKTALAAVDAAARFKMKEAVPGLRRAVEENLGRSDDPSRARVARALAEVEGIGALPFLRKRFDALRAKIERGSFYLKRDLLALVSGLLGLSPGDVDVLHEARAVLTSPFAKLNTDPKTRTHMVEAVLQGARLGRAKALAPEIAALADRADVPAALRELALEIRN